MAFDKETRNKLQKLVGKARELLTEEFTRQFQGTYGIQPTGEITPLEKLGRLDDATRSVARLLRERIQHIASQSAGRGVVKEAINRVLREQAFTVLNRFAALKMAESRGIVQECVGGGFDSKGFKVFLAVAGTALGDIYDRYRVFLHCLFDELSLDLGVLFDRYSPYGLLFPRETALKELFELLNQSELKHLWAEDETIGWIYQYFNDEAERKKMRKESAAPRNSRELAVRNQFFTPRYVVQFLVDNTLGRTWYEMLQGETRLKESCEYLVRRPNEVFLAQGQEAPKEETKDNLSQEELLNQPVHIPFRAIKDPTDIRLLDPACGSMHFGLYAFDLFEQIYEEFWDLAQAGKLSESLHPASFILQNFSSKEALMREVPRLIIEHNLHGVDIDPRAAQIAGLSLWLRAQKSWQRLKVKPEDRPQIKRSNIVCAEPMPGEVEHLRDFCESLNQPAIGKMVELIFDKMKLAGEAGTLLKIEEEIAHLVTTAKKDWQAGPKLQQSDLFAEFTPVRATQSELGLDMSGITDAAFWDKAEERIYKALEKYAEQVDGDFTRRLFGEDAARGFAFIDVCRKRYDVVVMNPPFGEASVQTSENLATDYPSWNGNLLCAFMARSLGVVSDSGSVGCIYDRTANVKSSYEDYRRDYLLQSGSLFALADLGWEVLDANVEVAAQTLILGNANPAHFFDLRQVVADEKGAHLSRFLNAGSKLLPTIESAKTFLAFPNAALAYDMPVSVKRAFSMGRSIQKSSAYAVVGNQLKSDWHISCWWEIPCLGLLPNGPFRRLYNGGTFSLFYMPLVEVALWGSGGELVREHKSVYLRNASYHFLEGAGYGKRGEHVDAHAIPSGFMYTNEGQAVIASDRQANLFFLGLINSKLFTSVINLYCGQHKQSGYVNLFPIPVGIDKERASEVANLAGDCASEKMKIDACNEVSPRFSGRPQDAAETAGVVLDLVIAKANQIEEILKSFYGIQSVSEAEELAALRGRWPEDSIGFFGAEPIHKPQAHDAVSSRLSFAIGTAFGRWDIRYVTGERQPPPLPDPFDPLPVCPPGMLQNHQGLPAEPKDVPADYPLRISWPGILVDDEGHREDIVARVQDSLRVIWGDRADAIEQEACDILKVRSLRAYFGNPTKFFADHLKRYSKSRRQAPIYWPLSTPSGSYTLWLYYHRLTDQTLYTCINDFIDPKLAEVTGDLNRLQAVEHRNTADERELERLADLKKELTDMREELLRVAQLPYKPDLNDGVIINAAPLWKLFGLKKWQKSCQDCWDKLKAGDYDWAHLAMHIWPQRVREKCKSDKSLAIAHNCEDLYQEPPDAPKKRARKQATIEEEPEEDLEELEMEEME